METPIKEAPNQVQQAVQVLVEALKKDPEFYYAWQANIAMAFQDSLEFQEVKEEGLQLTACVMHRQKAHEVSNKAAKRFLDLLIK